MVANNSKVKRIAIVGLGSIGKKHLRILKKLRPEIEIILIRSGLGESCKEEKLAKATFKKLDDTDLHLDGAIISTPAPFHLDQAKEFVKKKIPILIEKPISHNLEKIKNFIYLCKKHNALVLIGYVLRYSPSLIFFNKMIVKNKLGKPIFVEINCSSYLPNWRPNKNYRKSVSARSDLGGGVLLELSHELDYLNWIFGPFSKINSKLNISGKLDIDVEDEAYLNLISKNKLPISVYLNFYKKENKRNCKFITSKGTLEWNGIKNCVTYHNHKGKMKKWNFKIKKDYMYENQLNHFLKCIEKKISPQVSLTSGIEALKLVVRAKESSLKKSIINI